MSLISDLYSDKSRGVATGILHLGVYLGFGLSQAAGIYLTNLDVLGYSWRVPYFITGAPGLLFAILLIFLPDPRDTIVDKTNKCNEKTEKLLKHSQDTECLKSRQPRLIDDARELGQTILTPFMITMFLAAACRHSAGFTWAYNCRLYFLSYYPHADVGTFFSVSAIVGGASGVCIGGRVADKLSNIFSGEHEAQSSKYNKTRIKLLILGSAMILSSPFACGVLAFEPPWAFISLFLYYLTAETWFAILFITIVDVANEKMKTTVLGIFLFLMNNIGGNLPVIIHPISKHFGYRYSTKSKPKHQTIFVEKHCIFCILV